MKLVRSIWILLAATTAARAEPLLNADFEELDAHRRPVGWVVLSDLDEAQYGEQNDPYRFDGIAPTVAAPGRGLGGNAMAFPVTGAWACGVSHHDRGRIDGQVVESPGSLRGKAALYQQVALESGTYRFSAYLRTAGGDCWSGAFSLGVATGGTTQYAHDDRTGIRWTKHDLAMRGDPEGLWPDWGEWQRRSTDSFTIQQRTHVTVWIRFNYVNRHGAQVRWEVDDAAIEPVPSHRPEHPEPHIITTRRSIDLGRQDNFACTIRAPREVGRITLRMGDPDGSRLVVHEDNVDFYTGGCRVVSDYRFPLDGSRVDRTVHVAVAGSQCRARLPDDHGFEVPLIGHAGGGLSIEIEHEDAGDVELILAQLPAGPVLVPLPVVGTFECVYDPSVDGEAWYINDHCVVPGPDGRWHMFGITHAEPFNPPEEDFFAHAVTPDLSQRPWQRQPHACHVNTHRGETHVWAPHIIRKGDNWYMFYCAGGANGDAYQINLRTSSDLRDWKWHEDNPLFTGIGNARDPMVLKLSDDRYLMYTTEPWDLELRFSAVMVRESRDLLHWGDPSPALILPVRDQNARRCESPFVFRCGEAYYLSVTGVGGGYRDTRLWRSVDPRQFRAQGALARIDAHAPEWLADASPKDAAVDGTAIDCPMYVTHCGWRQGGLHLAPVRWESRPCVPMGLLRLVDADRPTASVELRRRSGDREPFHIIRMADDPPASEGGLHCFLPVGRYTIAGPGSDRPGEIEIVEAQVTEVRTDQ